MTERTPSPERPLAAIVAADIAGYSRLMGIDEDYTIATLQTYRQEVFQPAIAKYQGRLANTAGDSYLIEFPSATNAVQFAQEVQLEISSRNSAAPDHLKVAYRIGLNLGDVVSDGDDLLGDGVNIAARIEEQAEPGGICVSRSIRDQVRDRLDMELVDLGEIKVKNISRPVRIFQIGRASKLQQLFPRIKHGLKKHYLTLIVIMTILVGGGSWYWYLHKPDFEPVRVDQMQLALPNKPSIAVMPFEFIGSSDDDGAFLTDGLSENITTHLTAIEGLFVIGKQSTRIFREKSADVREVASAFGVRYVLTGSLQKIGKRLRVTASLVDAVSGSQIWSSRFDRLITDWFSIQDEITLAVIEKVYGQAIAGEDSRRVNTKNLQGFIYSIKGRYEQQAFTPEGNKKAREFFEAALKLDPEIQNAITGISFSHLMDARMGFSKDPLGSLKLSENYAWRALKQNPNDLSAYRFLAMIRVVEKKPKQALEYINKALESGEGDADLLATVAWVHKYVGQPVNALTFFAKVKRLQPVHNWWLIADEYGALLDAERYDMAVEYSENYIASAPLGLEPLFRAYTAIPIFHRHGVDAAKTIIAEVLLEDSDLSIKSFHSFDLAYVDRKFPEKRYEVLRKLGMPD